MEKILELEGVIKFLINNLEKIRNSFAIDILKQIKTRINEKRIIFLNTLILFLNSGNFPSNESCLKYSPKVKLKNMQVSCTPDNFLLKVTTII